MDDDRMWTLLEIDVHRITALDTIAVAFRGWAITLTSALAGFGVTENKRSLVLAAAIVPLLFGALDFRNRATQLLHVARARTLEKRISPDFPLRPELEPPRSRFVEMMRSQYRSVIAFYGALLVITLLVLVTM